MADTLLTYGIQDDAQFSDTSIGTSDNLIQHSNSDYDIVTNLIYPIDLMDIRSQKNYMVFHINVNQDSKFVRDSSTVERPIRKSSGRFSETFPNAADASINGINTFGKKLSNYYTTGQFDLMSPSQGYSEAIEYQDKIDSMTNKMKTVVQETTKPLKRLKGSIMLYMPMQVGTEYSMDYSDASMGVIGSLASAANDGNTLNAAMNSASRVLTRIGANVAARGLNEVGASVGINGDTTGNFAQAINAATKTTFNPRREQLFHDVNFRTFTYQFDFAPQTHDECNNVVDIINTFKFHMHPEIDNSYFFFMYPSEFDIEYHIFDAGENPYINKIGACALQAMQVTYGPGSNWATLINGCPTQIHMTLTFLELAPLTKNLIKDGGY